MVAIVLASVLGLASPAPRPVATVAAPARAVALTFDDLPASRTPSLADIQTLTTRLLAQIRKLGAPAIGFVNETKLDDVPGQEKARLALLEAWLDAGLELGNHTYSHVRLSDTPLAAYEANVLLGERLTRPLMASHGLRIRYFRHPTLNTGPDLETKQAFERFLSQHGYTVAPVTVDSDEYLYALAYDRARASGDSALMQVVGDDYLRYMEETFAFFEQLSIRLLGREPAQVLLLHANALNAQYLDRLGAMMRRRGYRFVSLEEALRDPAYRLRDDYVGERGPSWLERWAITQGRDPGRPPELPDWLRDATR